MHSYSHSVYGTDSVFTFAPEFRVTDRRVGEVAVLDVNGLMAGDYAAHKFVERVVKLLHKGVRKFAVNMGSVGDVESSGLGALASSHNRIERAGGKLKLFAAPERVRRTLNRLRLDTIFEVLGDEEAALEAFGKPSTEETTKLGISH